MSRNSGGVSAQARRNAIIQLIKTCRDEHSAKSVTEVADYLNRKYSWDFQRKTYERDLTTDSIPGLCSTEDRPARFYFPEAFDPHFPLPVGEQDIQTLAIALAYLRAASPKLMGQLASSCENGLRSRMPTELNRALKLFTDHIRLQWGFAGRATIDDIESFSLILMAMRRGLAIQCKYASPRDKSPQWKKDRVRSFGIVCLEVGDVQPTFLVEDLDEAGPKKQFKRLMLSRMRGVSVTAKSYALPSAHETKKFEDSYANVGGDHDEEIDILIEGDREISTFFSERQIHPSQKLTKLSENKFRVEFRMGVRGVFRLFAGYPGHLTRVEPATLRKGLIESWKRGAQDLLKGSSETTGRGPNVRK